MLEQVRIQNFKSLKDVTLDLQKVNLLIGPNNSGKSNFLKALEVCGVQFVNNQSHVTINPSNYQRITFNRKGKKIIFSFKISNKTFDVDIEYNGENVYANWFKNGVYLDLKFPPIELPNYVLEIFNSVIVYRPNPLKLHEPFPILPNQERVNGEASNIVAFFDNIRDRDGDSFEAIKNDLNKCIPEFSRIDFDNVVPSEELKRQYGDKTFKRFGLYSQEQKQIYWANELSEGVLYLISLLCIIHQPNPPKLLLLEEPEKGIHPRRIREVMNFIFQLAEQKDIQVILTSHSEHVLEDFATMPEAVFVFDKNEEGATFVKNLKKDIIEPSHKRSDELGVERIDFTTNIGENWFMGLMGGVPL